MGYLGTTFDAGTNTYRRALGGQACSDPVLVMEGSKRKGAPDPAQYAIFDRGARYVSQNFSAGTTPGYHFDHLSPAWTVCSWTVQVKQHMISEEKDRGGSRATQLGVEVFGHARMSMVFR